VGSYPSVSEPAVWELGGVDQIVSRAEVAAIPVLDDLERLALREAAEGQRTGKASSGIWEVPGRDLALDLDVKEPARLVSPTSARRHPAQAGRGRRAHRNPSIWTTVENAPHQA
jgi:hypothetical protein